MYKLNTVLSPPYKSSLEQSRYAFSQTYYPQTYNPVSTQDTVSYGSMPRVERVLFYGYIEPYYIYVTNIRIAGIKSRKRAFLEISPIAAAIMEGKETINAWNQQKLLYELNTKKKNFEFYWQYIRVIEAKKPRLLSSGHIKIYPFYGKTIKITIPTTGTFNRIVGILWG